MYFVPLWMAIASTVFQYHGTHQGTLIDQNTNELLVNNEAFLYVANLLFMTDMATPSTTIAD